MIEEAIENKEQKAKQRAKEYERKREAKWRNRQMYHMRHTRDYEALGLPIGASKVDVKAAYKKLAGGCTAFDTHTACRVCCWDQQGPCACLQPILMILAS